MDLNKQYWENRYINNDTGWDVGTITFPIKEYFDQVENKELNILVPGSGNSYEAEYLFKSGFRNIFVVDIAQAALKSLKNRVADFPEDHLIHNDFFKLEGEYDIILEQTFFCAIDPALRKNYVLKCHELLRTGGRIVGVLFDDKLNDDKPPFGGNKEEYVDLFLPYFNIKKMETCFNSIPPRAGRELFINLVKK